MRSVKIIALLLTSLSLTLASPVTSLANLTNALSYLAARPLPLLSAAAVAHSNVSYVKGVLEVAEVKLEKCLNEFSNLSRKLDSEIHSMLVSPFEALETLGKLYSYYDCVVAWTRELEKVVSSMPANCKCSGNETVLIARLAGAKSVSEVLQALRAFNGTDVNRAVSCYVCEGLAKARVELINQINGLEAELEQMNGTLAMFQNLLKEYVESLK